MIKKIKEIMRDRRIKELKEGLRLANRNLELIELAYHSDLEKKNAENLKVRCYMYILNNELNELNGLSIS